MRYHEKYIIVTFKSYNDNNIIVIMYVNRYNNMIFILNLK